MVDSSERRRRRAESALSFPFTPPRAGTCGRVSAPRRRGEAARARVTRGSSLRHGFPRASFLPASARAAAQPVPAAPAPRDVLFVGPDERRGRAVGRAQIGWVSPLGFPHSRRAYDARGLAPRLALGLPRGLAARGRAVRRRGGKRISRSKSPTGSRGARDRVAAREPRGIDPGRRPLRVSGVTISTTSAQPQRAQEAKLHPGVRASPGVRRHACARRVPPPAPAPHRDAAASRAPERGVPRRRPGGWRGRARVHRGRGRVGDGRDLTRGRKEDGGPHRVADVAGGADRVLLGKSRARVVSFIFIAFSHDGRLSDPWCDARRLWQLQGLGFVSSSVALLRARFAAAGLTAPRASLGGPRSESAPRKDPRAPPGVVRALASPEA